MWWEAAMVGVLMKDVSVLVLTVTPFSMHKLLTTLKRSLRHSEAEVWCDNLLQSASLIIKRKSVTYSAGIVPKTDRHAQ